MVLICECITLLHVLHVKFDTLTEILQSHYTHFALKSLQCMHKALMPIPSMYLNHCANLKNGRMRKNSPMCMPARGLTPVSTKQTARTWSTFHGNKKYPWQLWEWHNVWLYGIVASTAFGNKPINLGVFFSVTDQKSAAGCSKTVLQFHFGHISILPGTLVWLSSRVEKY